MEAILNRIDSYIEHIMDNDEKLLDCTQIQSKRWQPLNIQVFPSIMENKILLFSLRLG